MVRDLRARLPGRRITGVDIAFTGSIGYPEPRELVDRVVGQEIVTISRRGKYAVLGLASDDRLIVHRGMTGSLLVRRRGDDLESHVRLTFLLDNDGELRFRDMRKFGRVLLMHSGERALPFEKMGPEPLRRSFTAARLAGSLQGRSGLLKPLLLGQRVVAGLGNIYVDEALFHSRIHPRRVAGSLSEAEVGRLHRAIRSVLNAAIEGRGTTFRSYEDINGNAGAFQSRLAAYGRVGEPCRRCGWPIERIVVGGRGTYFCPHCQI